MAWLGGKQVTSASEREVALLGERKGTFHLEVSKPMSKGHST